MRENLNLIFPIWGSEKNEGQITGMNMDLFCVTQSHMWKSSTGHSIQLPVIASYHKILSLSPDYFKIGHLAATKHQWELV